MTPVSKLLSELFSVNPSFIIVYNKNNKKTCLIEGEFEVSAEDTLDQAILCAWIKVFGMNKEKIYGSQQ